MSNVADQSKPWWKKLKHLEQQHLKNALLMMCWRVGDILLVSKASAYYQLLILTCHRVMFQHEIEKFTSTFRRMSSTTFKNYCFRSMSMKVKTRSHAQCHIFINGIKVKVEKNKRATTQIKIKTYIEKYSNIGMQLGKKCLIRFYLHPIRILIYII